VKSGPEKEGGHPPKAVSWADFAWQAIGAVLLIGAGLGVTLASRAGLIGHAHRPVEILSTPHPASAEPVDHAVILAAADPSKGAEAAVPCRACHSFEPNGPTMMGPTLYGVFGRDIASISGSAFSEALKAKEGAWDAVSLDGFLENPKRFANGTYMSFAGMRNDAERANLIAYLRTLAPGQTPVAPPQPSPAPTESPTAVASAAPSPAASGPPAASPSASPSPAASASPAAPAGRDWRALMTSADVANGDRAAAMCKACHSIAANGPNMVGPNIYGVIGRNIASVEGFTYSGALQGLSGRWTYDRLDHFLEKPSDFAAGTTMAAFPGVASAKDRADIIAWLRTLAPEPAPLPPAR
jgi:cytochrome c2